MNEKLTRANVALSIYAALLTNGRDPSASVEQSLKFADFFLAKVQPQVREQPLAAPKDKSRKKG